MQTEIRGIRGGGSAEEVGIKITRFGDIHVNQMLPSGALLAAKGDSWTVITTTAIPALVNEPSADALLLLYNGEAAGGKSYIIERIFAYQDVSGTNESRWSLWAMVIPVGYAAPTVEIAVVDFGNMRGVANYGGNARPEVDASTLTDYGWSPWSSSLDVEPTITVRGAAVSVDVDGLMVIPPTAALALHVVASSVDEDFTVGIHWHEVVLDLGT